jgi:hypothetical protein
MAKIIVKEEVVTKDEFQDHCLANQKTDEKLEKIMWLADPEMKKALKEIVTNQQSMTNVGKRVIKIIGYLSAFFGLIYLMFKMYKDIK